MNTSPAPSTPSPAPPPKIDEKARKKTILGIDLAEEIAKEYSLSKLKSKKIIDTVFESISEVNNVFLQNVMNPFDLSY